MKMITKVQNTPKQQKVNFGINPLTLTNNIDRALKLPLLFVKSQENLSSTRFIQDTATNWFPKAIFTRSKADFAEMSFLEFLESAIFYFAPPILGELVARKHIFSKMAPKALRKQINEQLPKKAAEILKDTNLVKCGIAKRAIPLKAAIVLSCACIPAAEYALSFAKNLFTLKVFKKSDFNNIANLNKNPQAQKENKEQQERVEKSAKSHLKKAGIFSVVALGASLILGAVGHKYKPLQKLSEAILEPGLTIGKGLQKLGIKSEKLNKFLGTYVSSDFSSNNGKLALSKGQLAITTISGLFGYSAAAGDRGRLDKLEVWTRVPLVVLYTIFGSSLFDSAFKHILKAKNKFPDLIKKGADGAFEEIPALKDLPQIAEKIAKTNKTNVQKEFNRLVKEKSIITAVPYAFSLVFMGFLLSGITRLWTQYRYNHQVKDNKTRATAEIKTPAQTSEVFFKNKIIIKTGAPQNTDWIREAARKRPVIY